MYFRISRIKRCTHHGAEVDLVFARGYTVVATAEVKYSNSPQFTKGNFQAIDDLKAPMNYVITPSSDDFMMKENIRVCSLKKFNVELFEGIVIKTILFAPGNGRCP